MSLHPMSEVDLTFWLGLMRDHALFIRNTLGPTETDAVQRAEQLIARFERLLAGRPTAAEAVAATEELIEFKRDLLMRLMDCRLIIHLPPAGLNQMLNEAQEFLGTVGVLPILPADPFALLLHLHQLWLYDAAAHSGAAVRGLDPGAMTLAKEFRRFDRLFLGFLLRAQEQAQIHDKMSKRFRAVLDLTRESGAAIEAHLELVASLEELRVRCEIEGTLSPLQPDHWTREERHYLEQVARILPELA